MRPRIYENGQTFGRLKITSSYTYKIGNRWYHKVLCECGTIKYVCGSDMTKGGTLSCGCLKFTHAMTGSKEYKCWSSMIQRCTNSKNSAYKNYGGRGITVCDSWFDFNNFFNDMGFLPFDKAMIDRVDNEKGYFKENCVWSDRFTQNINQRVRADNKTGCKGVSFNKNTNQYVANINRNNKRTYLGSFDDIDQAIKARKSAEERIGE